MPDRFSTRRFDLSDGERLESALAEYMTEVEAGRPPDRGAFMNRHPDLAAELSLFFDNHDRMEQVARPLRTLNGSSRQAEPDLLIGTQFGDYEIIEQIGRGGMGVIYKARQISLDRIVALKLILTGRLATAGDRKRFRAEAEAVATLTHPNIVPIYHVGEHDGYSYFSMKLIEGPSLAQRIDGKPMPPRQAAPLMAAVARAVHHAHQRSILHRDLKPGNILLDKQDVPHVTDFGLAKRFDLDQNLTKSQAVLGTPSYMAPEQAAGSTRDLTTSTDVYALGAILYAVLTGEAPFRGGTTIETLRHVQERLPTPPSRLNGNVDRDLETICLKCLEKDPSRRYGSAEALAEDLERWMKNEPIKARRAGNMERLKKWVKRKPAAAALVAVVIVTSSLLLAGLIVANVVISRSLDRESQTAEQLTGANTSLTTINKELRLKHEHLASRETAILALNESIVREKARLEHLVFKTAWIEWNRGDPSHAYFLLDQLLPEDRGWRWSYFEHLCKVALGYHKHNVLFSPSGQLLATRHDKGLQIYNTARADPTGYSLDAAHNQLLAFSDDDRVLAAAGGWGDSGTENIDRFEISLWNLGNGDRIGIVEDAGLLRGMAVDPKGLRLAVAHSQVDNRVEQIEFSSKPGSTFPRRHRRVAPGSILRIYDIATQKHVILEGTGTTTARLLAFSPNTKWLAVAAADQVLLVDIETGQIGHRWDTAALAVRLRFSSDSRLLAAVFPDRIQVWNTDDGRRLHDVPHPRVLDVAFSQTNVMLAACDRDWQLSVWNLATLTRLAVQPWNADTVSSVASSPVHYEFPKAIGDFQQDWSQYGREPGRNMVAASNWGVPDMFTPAMPKARNTNGTATRNVKWAFEHSSASFSSPVIAARRVYIGSIGQRLDDSCSVLYCLDEHTGKLEWQFSAPGNAEGEEGSIGICSSPSVVGNRVYFVTNRFEVICLDVNGMADGNDGPYTDEAKYVVGLDSQARPQGVLPSDADIIWRYDMREQLGISVDRITSSSPVVVGDMLFASTSNGARAGRRLPTPLGPSLVCLDRHTGRLLAIESSGIGHRVVDAAVSSPCYGELDGRGYVFFAGPDGFIYCFGVEPTVDPMAPHRRILREMWRVDGNPSDHHLGPDGKSPNRSASAATPVFHRGHLYISLGSPVHGNGDGPSNAICIDVRAALTEAARRHWSVGIQREPTSAGRSHQLDVTAAAIKWSYRRASPSRANAVVTDELTFIADTNGWVHAVDTQTGRLMWKFDTGGYIWRSILVVGRQIHVGNGSGTYSIIRIDAIDALVKEFGEGISIEGVHSSRIIVGANRTVHSIEKHRMATVAQAISTGSRFLNEPVVANGTLYLQSDTHLNAITRVPEFILDSPVR